MTRQRRPQAMLGKTFDPGAVERKQYDRWLETGAFRADPASPRRPWTIMMPPPNVTGSLHMGHALNMTLQDVLVRHQRKRGYDVMWMPGTDHASIATHMVLERQLEDEGVTRFDLGRDAFLERAQSWKDSASGTIQRQLRYLGCSPDWPRERFTMDEGLSRAVLTSFLQLYREGLIYRDKRLVNWDPQMQTAVSDLEVDLKETEGRLWHLRYPLQDDPARHIVVATTRPETMLGDTGVAVHPEDERYKHLIGRNVMLPICERPIPIVADEHADPEQGSGAVKITPAHDFNDFEVGRRHGLEVINVFDSTAQVNANAPEAYRGLDRYAAREKVVARFEELGLLDSIEETTIYLPRAERSGQVIEPWLTDQWFCDAITLAQPAIEAVEQGRTRFIPENWTNTYFQWMRNIQPWCISRQLWWGHRIPAWYGPDGEVFVAEDEAAAHAEAEKHYGKRVELERDPDVLDTWFSSALWPFSTLGWPEETPEVERYYPGDTLVTGFDIIFFWVARMMMMGLHFKGEVPFRDVYIHALVRDAYGQKMSKTKGNVIDPLDLIERFGADALRFTLTALTAQGRDIKMSESRVEGYRNFATKLWNAARYAQMNGCEPQPGFDPAGCRLRLNRWIVSELAATKEAVDAALDAYRFDEASQRIYQFVWGSFCDWYVELSKPVLAHGSAEDAAEVRAATAWTIAQLLQVLHPFMPFITEELWEHFAAADPEAEGRMLIQAGWPDYAGLPRDADAVGDLDWLVRLIRAVRTVRAETNIPASARIDLLIKDAGADTRRRLADYAELVRPVGRVARIEEVAEAPAQSAQVLLGEATLIMPLADVIDIENERARLQKEIGRLDQELQGLEKKLAKPDFLNKAPSHVVEDARQRRDEADAARSKLRTALERLSQG